MVVSYYFIIILWFDFHHNKINSYDLNCTHLFVIASIPLPSDLDALSLTIAFEGRVHGCQFLSPHPLPTSIFIYFMWIVEFSTIPLSI